MKKVMWVFFPWWLLWYIIANFFRIGFVLCVFAMRFDPDRARQAWEETE